MQPNGDIPVTICKYSSPIPLEEAQSMHRGAILAVSDWISRTNVSNGKAPLTVKNILECMIMAHEIQGCLALENSFNKVGLGAYEAYLTRMISTFSTADQRSPLMMFRSRPPRQSRLCSCQLQASWSDSRSDRRCRFTSIYRWLLPPNVSTCS